MNQTQNEDFVQPRIVRNQVDSLSLFEITDYELTLLSQRSPNSICLNFAIFFLSIAFSSLTTLLSINIVSQRVFIVFAILSIVGFAVGIVLLGIWLIMRKKTGELVKKIKARVPEISTEVNNQNATSAQQTKKVIINKSSSISE